MLKICALFLRKKRKKEKKQLSLTIRKDVIVSQQNCCALVSSQNCSESQPKSNWLFLLSNNMFKNVCVGTCDFESCFRPADMIMSSMSLTFAIDLYKFCEPIYQFMILPGQTKLNWQFYLSGGVFYFLFFLNIGMPFARCTSKVKIIILGLPSLM